MTTYLTLLCHSGHKGDEDGAAGLRYQLQALVVTKGVDAYLVVMEGHVRLTAYLIAPQYLPSELEVLLGTCEQITDWGCY